MKICPTCQNKYQEIKNFCPKCGIKLIPEKAGSPEAFAKRESFKTQIAKDPTNASLYLEFSDFLVSLSLYDDALEQCFKALELEPDNETSRSKIIEIYRIQQNWDKVATQLLLLIEKRPKDLSLFEQLVNAYISGDRKSEAAEILAQMSELEPQNTDFLKRQRDLLKELDQIEKLINVCYKILKLELHDLTTWILLADSLLKSDNYSGALTTFEAIQSLEPNNARANLYVGMALHDAELSSEKPNFSEVSVMLEKAIAGIKNLSSLEGNLAYLYLCSIQLRYGKTDEKLKKTLNKIDSNNFDNKCLNLLSQCYLLLGDIENKARNIDKAINYYKTSLKIFDNAEAKKRIADIFTEEGDRLLKKRNYKLAEESYISGLKYSPDSIELKNKKHIAIDKQEHKIAFIRNCVITIIIIAIVIAVIIYYAHGAFDIQVDREAIISILKGEKILTSKTDKNLKTDQLLYGSYTLNIEEDGFEVVNKEIKTGFGRKINTHKIQLTPVYGSLKVDSDPSGAIVKIKNKYSEKTGKTPCEINDILAMNSNIEVVVSDLNPFEVEKKIPAKGTLDLGKIVFKGSLKVDSNPSGAEVYIDSKKKGITPLTTDGLLAKKTLIKLEKFPDMFFSSDIQVKPNKVTDLGIIELSQPLAGVWKGKWKCTSSCDCYSFIIFEENQNIVHEGVFRCTNDIDSIVVQNGTFEKEKDLIYIKHNNARVILGSANYNPDKRRLILNGNNLIGENGDTEKAIKTPFTAERTVPGYKKGTIKSSKWFGQIYNINYIEISISTLENVTINIYRTKKARATMEGKITTKGNEYYFEGKVTYFSSGFNHYRPDNLTFNLSPDGFHMVGKADDPVNKSTGSFWAIRVE